MAFYLKRSLSVCLILSIIILSSCTVATRKQSGETISAEEAKFGEGRGDAYLFDAKIYRDGKKNSVRLDVYYKNEQAGVFARGYLGKGVLKGIIDKDSIIVYFPTEDQFYTGEIASLVKGDCRHKFDFESIIIQLMTKLPSDIKDAGDDYYVTILKDKGKTREYRLESRHCPEHIILEYDLKENRFILDKIDFRTEDDSFRFKAERRKFRLNVDIPVNKIVFDIPEDAARILP